MEKSFIFIADSHLGSKENDVETMCHFITTCDPQTKELVFLGDIFHIWAGPSKFHTSQVKQLLSILRSFRENEGKIHMVIGNRDVLFNEYSLSNTQTKLPFNQIASEYLFLNNNKIICAHGDRVNSQDERYLKWQKTINHPVFKGLFSLLPAFWVKKIMSGLEEKLQNTNMNFRYHFPDSEWTNFMNKVSHQFKAELLLIGHFHPEKLLVNKNNGLTGLVLPAWCEKNEYMEMNLSLEYDLKQFQN